MTLGNLRRQQRPVNMTELERICNRRSIDIQRLAGYADIIALPGYPIKANVGQAVNILIYSILTSASFEPAGMAQWVGLLRNETLIALGSELENWTFEGADELSYEFWPQFYARPRDFAARLLQCPPERAARQCRFHSHSDVEWMTQDQFHLGNDGRTPLLVIDAHDLAYRVRSACSGSLFTASPIAPGD